jgi:4-amino-4-deoxy-L-arabinose transferase-like glycosyltransferase
MNLVNKLLNFSFKWIRENKFLLCSALLYFVLRLINLTKLPIFNDEAIYLDWGWRETHRTGNLYYSLYDAKQPFLMWIFGISESIFSDPLFAGRLVSVFAGLLTLVGIYKITKDFFTQKAALLAALFYIAVPIFSFYDRQALMESSIAAVGIWSCFFILKSIKEKSSLKYPIFAGLILGIGLFIKSSSLVFLVSYAFFVLFHALYFKKMKMINNFFASSVIFLATVSLLLINPQFWDTIGSNSRYTLTVSELLAFPFVKWLQSFLANLQIGFYGITPLLFLASLIGIIMILRKKDLFKNIFLSFFIMAFLVTTFFVRTATERYLISFLPFLVIPASYLTFLFFAKNKIFGTCLMVIIFIVPFCLTVFQVVRPANYLLAEEKLTYFDNSGYLHGFTSGYGINGTVDYFKKISVKNKITVTIAENTGNPESAIIDYFNKSLSVQVVYMDARIFGPGINVYDCFSSSVPLYFVARGEQLAGLNKYLEKLKMIKNPYGPNTIGIYVLKKNCKGKTFQLNPMST